MQETPPGQTGPFSRFNLSRWALDHPAFTRYLMVVLMLFGIASYFQLGQDEDPPFTFRAMVVRAYWPGATAQQVAEQVTDKIERTLQEVPYADKIRSYSKPGETLIIFQIADSSPASAVQGTWYTVRKKIGDMTATLPQGVVGPFFNDEFGDVYGVIYALQGEGFSPADKKLVADDVRQRLLPLHVDGLRDRTDAVRIVIALQHDAFAHQQPARQQRLFHEAHRRFGAGHRGTHQLHFGGGFDRFGAVDGDRGALRNLAGTMAGEQHQLEAVFYLVDAIFNCDTGHCLSFAIKFSWD